MLSLEPRERKEQSRRRVAVSQDAVEYFQYLLELITKEESGHKGRLGVGPEEPLTAASFSFKMVDRIQCNETRALSYSTYITTDMGLDIPLEAATNQAEIAKYKVRSPRPLYTFVTAAALGKHGTRAWARGVCCRHGYAFNSG